MEIDITQLKFIDIKLRSILVWIEHETGVELTITSLYRMNNNGVHGTLPLRGTDLRCRNLNVGQELESLVNFRWVYDPARPGKRCAILHGAGSNSHLHIQVHSNTLKND